MLGSESIAYRRQPAARSLRTDLISGVKEATISRSWSTPSMIMGEESLAEHLAEIGVDGLFTDDPARAQALSSSGIAPRLTAVRGRCGSLVSPMIAEPVADRARPGSRDR